ncbi:MAG: reverse transcriptase domain-containing protein [Ferruginibacter sp.]
MKKEKDWFKLKKYPHIGLPLKATDRPWVQRYVLNTDAVKAHAFYPLIHRTSVVRKYRRDINKDTGKRSAERYAKSKPRELYYANHLDACIYGYYAKGLNEAYDAKLLNLGLHDTVTAYRRIKLNPTDPDSVNKSSADFAAEVFNYIINHQEDQLVAISFDIQGFFDNLDHKLLKKAWYEILNKKTLPEAEYNIFNNITNFSFINENQIFNAFKDEIIVESKTGIRKRKPIKKFHHLKNQRAIAFCELTEFEKVKSNKLIVGNHDPAHPKRIKGIPQGTPISAALANVYMIDFDYRVNKYVKNLKGLYRRYSDDMIVICEAGHIKDIIDMFDSEIAERRLDIQHDKTQVFKFDRVHGKFKCEQLYKSGSHPHKNMEYLGFEFDGFHTYLKSSSLASYYRKMKRSVQRGRYYSKTITTSKAKGKIFQTRLYKKFTYLGAGRRRIYVKDKTNPTNWIRTDTYDWGNYISYAQLAINKLPNNKIKGQIKRHWSILNKLIK